MIDLLQSLLQHLIHIGGFLMYGGMTWVTAYALKVTAPLTCPDGDEYAKCHKDHGPTHVVRNDAGWALFLGLFWPLWLVAFAVRLLMKSIDGAVAITPMPKPKMSQVDLSRALEAAEYESEQTAAEIEALHREQMDRQWQEDHPFAEPIQGRVVEEDPGYSRPRPDPSRREYL